jgi:hypothetical protein
VAFIPEEVTWMPHEGVAFSPLSPPLLRESTIGTGEPVSEHSWWILRSSLHAMVVFPIGAVAQYSKSKRGQQIVSADCSDERRFRFRGQDLARLPQSSWSLALEQVV